MGTPVAAKGGRILVVDDDPMIRDTLGQVLADEGYVADVAVDGNDALERVHSARPDTILLDLMMPGMNGRQFLEALRADPEYRKVPVLIMTAVHGLNANFEKIGVSATDVVEKPFNIEELLNKIALAIYRSRDADAPVAPSIPPVPVPAPEPSDRGVVLVVEHDRARLTKLDLLLSEHGYTVVSMTRALAQLSRLARALRPRSILLELRSEGVHEVVRDLRADKDLDPIPLQVFSRDDGDGSPDVLAHAADSDLLAFVEKQR